ncbi:hypothetical protein TNCV_1654821 [Trichonephila clavipes]|nr:hypothetical protein TNCV_1654821 [Trichonephila clavipes]
MRSICNGSRSFEPLSRKTDDIKCWGKSVESRVHIRNTSQSETIGGTKEARPWGLKGRLQDDEELFDLLDSSALPSASVFFIFQTSGFYLSSPKTFDRGCGDSRTSKTNGEDPR